MATKDELLERIDKLENALQENERQYHSFVESHPYGIHRNDISGTITYANQAYCDIFGFDSPDQAVGTKVWDLLPTEEAKEQLRQYLAYLAHEQPEPSSYESATTTVDGEPIVLKVDWDYLRDEDGSVVGFISVSNDITEQKAAEDQLRESQRLLQTFLDNFPDLAFVKDEDGNILMGNRQLDRFFGAEKGSLIGKTVYDLVPEEIADAIWASEKQVLETGEVIEVEEEVMQGGQMRTKFSTKFPLYDEKDEIYAVGGITMDITEQKEVQAEQERLQQEIIEAQQQALKELATPIIPVMDRILVMPLIGSIDTMRARDITRSLLSGIREHRAKVVILDITGVPIVDSGVADHLNKTIQAARLKGARTIVTGISDAVAETIVDLGIDWTGIETLSDLQTGLIAALNSLGVKLTR